MFLTLLDDGFRFTLNEEVDSLTPLQACLDLSLPRDPLFSYSRFAVIEANSDFSSFGAPMFRNDSVGELCFPLEFGTHTYFPVGYESDWLHV